MINRYSLTEKHLHHAIQNGDFPEEILTSSKYVAVVMTQSWCPQWVFMRSWLSRIGNKGNESDISIYETEYDKLPSFNDFRTFKESSFNNWEVPYVRYYSDGKLIGESNFVSETSFLDFFT